MSLILLMACSGGSLKKGGSPSTISMTMIPRDQMSTALPLKSPEVPVLRHSGGVKAGVPAVAVSLASRPSNSSLTPRSAILTSPLSALKRLLGLISRWITF